MQIVLWDFWASWCGPCKVTAPIVEELAKEYAGKIEVRKIEVDDPVNQKTVEEYEINSMPTFVIEKDGRVVSQLIGAQPKSQLKAAIDYALTE